MKKPNMLRSIALLGMLAFIPFYLHGKTDPKTIMLCLLSRAKAEKKKKNRQFTNSIILGSQASRPALKVN